MKLIHKLVKKAWYRGSRIFLSLAMVLFTVGYVTPTPEAQASTCATSGNNVTISSNCYWSAGSYTFTGTLTVSGGVTVTAYSNTSGNGSGVTVTSDNIVVSGAISANGQGFNADSGPGYYGPGNGAGGGHGGRGGQEWSGTSPYGSETGPLNIGSGGDSGSGTAGKGGGAIKLVSSGTVTVGGSVTADGAASTGGGTGGGGAGGSVWIDANSLAGGGYVSAIGGNGNTNFGSGGGGGRVALVTGDDTAYDMTAYAYGGTAPSTSGADQPGGAGTLFRHPGSQTDGHLIIDNNSVSGNYTDQASSSLTVDYLTVGAGAHARVTGGRVLSVNGQVYGTGSPVPWLGTNGGTLNWPGSSVTVSGFNSYNAGAFGTVTDLTLSGVQFDWYGGAFSAGLNSITMNSGTTMVHYTTSTLSMTGDLTVNSGATITSGVNTTGESYKVDISADNITLAGSVDVNFRGYDAAQGPGYYAPGNGAGGGHGGRGGQEWSGSSPYGSVTNPVNIGSGGDNGSGTAGKGGGAIKLIAADTFDFSGTLSANGAASTGGGTGGGGAAGSIWVQAPTLTGSGAGGIHANGGAGNVNFGSGGGGGRISVISTSGSVPAWSMYAYGGTAPSTSGADTVGGAGTIYTKSFSQDNGDLIINNGGSQGARTDQAGTASQTYDNVTVNNGSIYVIRSGYSLTIPTGGALTGGGSPRPWFSCEAGGNYYAPSSTWAIDNLNVSQSGAMQTVTDITLTNGQYDWYGGTFPAGLADYTVGSGGTLVHYTTGTLSMTGDLTVLSGGTITSGDNSTAQSYKVVINADNIDIQGSGQVNVDYRGFDHEYGPGMGDNGSGGGYGGAGGRGNNVIGPTYGSNTEPADIGSGGANGNSAGGNGGGAVKLTASGNLTVSGTISANGSSGTSGTGGGGSGGAIWVTANAIYGDGTLRANGADGNNDFGGGGGGGRIAVYYALDSSTWTKQVNGGAAPSGSTFDHPGTAGTIYTEQTNVPPVAVDDDYAVSEGGSLDISAANGVLDNDSDADPLDTITATNLNVTGTQGSVTLNSDGSFEYTPPANWGGIDTFTYTANDSLTDSDPATVSVTVSTNDRTTIQYAVLDRLSAGSDSSFGLNFNVSNTLTSSLTVTFPAGFTVNGAYTSGTCSGGGTIDTFTYDSLHLYAEKTNCAGTISLSGADITLPSTAGFYTITWTNDDPGETTIVVTDDDHVSVTGNVDPTLTFDIDIGKVTGDNNAQPYAIDFGQIDFASPESSDNTTYDSIWLDFETNATGGGTIFVRSANAAMKSQSTTDQFASAGASLAANTEEYGICVDSTIVGTPRSGHPGGTAWTAQGNYATGASCDGGATMDVGLLSTSDTALMTAAGPLDAGRVQVRVGMSVATSTPAHPDYQDVLTFIATSTY